MDSDPQPVFRRVLLKISGEALAGSDSSGINFASIEDICRRISEVRNLGVQIALVMGGGNIFRGLEVSESGFDRATADAMGMLATVINSLAMLETFDRLQVEARLMSAIRVGSFAEPYSVRRARHHLDRKRLLVLAGGTGNPYFSTDSASALRASELKAEVLLKATKVKGVYSEDPMKNSGARFFEALSYRDVIEKQLGVMDLTSITMCRENDIPIVVFELGKDDNLRQIILGNRVGTIISKNK